MMVITNACWRLTTLKELWGKSLTLKSLYPKRDETVNPHGKKKTKKIDQTRYHKSHSTWPGPVMVVSHERDKVLAGKMLTLSSPVLPISFWDDNVISNMFSSSRKYLNWIIAIKLYVSIYENRRVKVNSYTKSRLC